METAENVNRRRRRSYTKVALIPPQYRTPRERPREINETADIVLRLKAMEGNSFVKVLRKARAGISLREVQLSEIKARRTAKNNLLIEVDSERCTGKVDKLAKRLIEVIGEDIDVTRPTRTADINVRGFDESLDK